MIVMSISLFGHNSNNNDNQGFSGVGVNGFSHHPLFVVQNSSPLQPQLLSPSSQQLVRLNAAMSPAAIRDKMKQKRLAFESGSVAVAADAATEKKIPAKVDGEVDEYDGRITKAEVRALFDLWNSALATGDSRIVAKRYTESCSLLPTVSDTPRTDYDSVKDYFDAFLKKEPQGKIIEGFIKIGDNGDWASDTGIYEFTMGVDGSKVRGRYSYIYVIEDGVWKIQHHHSSVMPEEIAMGKAITEDEVKGLFNLWNDALATLDSTKVAARYARDGVLLPTVSDTPRTGTLHYFYSRFIYSNFTKTNLNRL